METLESLKNDFDHWRQNKPSKHSPIPKELWARAVELSRTVDPIEVSKACLIPATKIRSKLRALNGDPSPVVFAKASIPSVKRECIELSTPSGIVLKIYS